jgi:separase
VLCLQKLSSFALRSQAVVDLRAILEEDGAQEAAPQEDNHLFLILDKSMHAFPWESFPAFAGLSISRIPSLTFLHDRMERIGYSSTSQSNRLSTTAPLNPRKTYFVLNPGGDLKHTEKVFSDVVNQRDWNGVTGRQPMEEEVRQGLATADVFL